MESSDPMDHQVLEILQRGVVIPAHPLALTAERKLDERRQAALTRYYCEAGAGGIAVGVHTTQFAIRNPNVGLLEPVLRLAAYVIGEFERGKGRRIARIAGICGLTPQAVNEAALARECGYDAGLLSLAAFPTASDDELLDHCREVAREIPLFGFYLQPSVGGRLLSHEFWLRFCEIPAVAAIKVAPFNRYQTLDVMRAVSSSGRASEIALYTGNDDNIIPDLLAEFRLNWSSVSFRGGLLGQWAVWTRRAVELLEEIRTCRAAGGSGMSEILSERSGPNGCQRCTLRRAQPLRRLYPGTARNPPAARTTGGAMVPGRERRPFARPIRGD